MKWRHVRNEYGWWTNLFFRIAGEANGLRNLHNQAKYARSLVKRFGLDKAAHVRTPMVANAKLANNPSGESVDVTLYRSMIGCLLYLTASQPNIAFSVGVFLNFNLILKFHIWML